MLALEIFNWKEKENARLLNTYGARLYIGRGESLFLRHSLSQNAKLTVHSLSTLVTP